MYEVDLHINSVSNNKMGYIYEEMLRRFTENSAAGEQYTPRVSDGSLLFLQNMISKMYKDEEGSRIAIIFNGSPLFIGDAGSGESNIRKWIIENDLLEGIIALPTDMFYNTGIATYIWILTNRKKERRKGKIQLVNATEYYQSMRKSLGNKRKEISEDQIKEIKALYASFEENENCKIFDNKEFGYRKITIERPLKLSFKVNEESIEKVKETTQFINLAVSKKKDETVKAQEEAKGREEQEKIIKMLQSFDSDKEYLNREEFIKELKGKAKEYGVKLGAAILKAMWTSIGERKVNAEVCS